MLDEHACVRRGGDYNPHGSISRTSLTALENARCSMQQLIPWVGARAEQALERAMSGRPGRNPSRCVRADCSKSVDIRKSVSAQRHLDEKRSRLLRPELQAEVAAANLARPGGASWNRPGWIEAMPVSRRLHKAQSNSVAMKSARYFDMIVLTRAALPDTSRATSEFEDFRISGLRISEKCAKNQEASKAPTSSKTRLASNDRPVRVGEWMLQFLLAAKTAANATCCSWSISSTSRTGSTIQYRRRRTGQTSSSVPRSRTSVLQKRFRRRGQAQSGSLPSCSVSGNVTRRKRRDIELQDVVLDRDINR